MNTTKAVSRTLSLVMILLMTLTALCACSGGVTREEAETTTEAFFSALSEGDYETAYSLFHPNKGKTPDELMLYCETLATDYGIDLTKGATIEKYTGMSSSYYDSEVDGSRYELIMRVKVGETTATFRVQVVRNDAGFGIWNWAFVRP